MAVFIAVFAASIGFALVLGRWKDRERRRQLCLWVIALGIAYLIADHILDIFV